MTNRVLQKRLKDLNPDANPFHNTRDDYLPPRKKPIEIVEDDVKALKKAIMELRSENTLLKNMLIPVRKEYLKRMADEEEREKEMVVETKGWWFQ